MIVHAEVQIANADPNLTAHLVSHPAILERSVLHYRFNGDNLTIVTRVQIEARTLDQAHTVFMDAFKIDTTQEVNVDEASFPTVTLTELDEY